MTQTVGNCPNCRMTNSLKAIKCIECGARLPWADEAEKAAQATKPVAPTVRPAPPRASSGDDDDEDIWWQTLGAGLLLLGGSFYLYWYFTSWEASGGIRRMRWWAALAYSIGGKWPIIMIVGLLGLIGVGFGISEFLKRKK